jgi:raffinose/stachyose/melibiose transport system permease protein
MTRYGRWAAFREIGLWIAAVPVLLPIYFVISMSLKGPGESDASLFRPPSHPTLDNYSQAWNQAGGGAVTFARAMANSVITTVSVVALLICVALPAGYALARRGTRMAGALFGLFSLGLILPVQLGLIPLYAFMVNVGLAGTRLGLIIIYVGLLLPLAVFLYTGFLRGLPSAYEEAARVDGASSLRILRQIVFPLVRPVTGAVAILTGLFVWNDFFTPLVYVGGTSNETLPVAVYSFVGRYSTDWSLIFASAAIALAPVIVIYALTQRYVMKGFVSTLRG